MKELATYYSFFVQKHTNTTSLLLNHRIFINRSAQESKQVATFLFSEIGRLSFYNLGTNNESTL